MTAVGAACGTPWRDDLCDLSVMGEGVAEGGLEDERAGSTGGNFEGAGFEATLDADVAVGIITSDGVRRFACVCVCIGSAGCSSIVPSPNNTSMTPAPCCPCCCSTVNVDVSSMDTVASAVATGKPHWARNMSTRSLASDTLEAFATIRRISCTSEVCAAGRLGMYLVETETEVELELDLIGLGARGWTITPRSGMKGVSRFLAEGGGIAKALSLGVPGTEADVLTIPLGRFLSTVGEFVPELGTDAAPATGGGEDMLTVLVSPSHWGTAFRWIESCLFASVGGAL